MASSRPTVDIARNGSLSFAPPEPTAHPIAITPAPRPLIPRAVGPGNAIPATVHGSGGLLGAMPEYPVQIEKIQAPPLRDDILARDRLLDWLNVKIHNRVVLVTAEAGYGKTTLLADFARRTRLRVLWFRLDRGDRDWVGFIAYLLAAVRLHQPDFGPMTGALLADTGSSAPPLETVLDAFLRELGDLSPEPAALVFDDFHLVDDSEDVRRVTNELVARAPERIAFVFLSRVTPPLRFARLKSIGEFSELTSEDLRFDSSETARLFADEGLPQLDPGLIGELASKTEGWPASLNLVRTAIRRRDPRSAIEFVRGLSGNDGDLHDYLAEEVIGNLDPELQDFLMRTSVLDPVSLDLGIAATDRSDEKVRGLVDAARKLGLLTRTGRASHTEYRAHPLVRQFLRGRLERTLGPTEIRRVHTRIAVVAEGIDWRRAAYHHAEAGDSDAVIRVLNASLPRIVGTGAFLVAEALIQRASLGHLRTSTPLVIASRLAQQRGETEAAIALAEEALGLDSSSAAAITTLMAARALAGDAVGSAEAAARLEQSSDSEERAIATAYRLMLETSASGSIDRALLGIRHVERVAAESANHRFQGVALANEALLLKAAGRPGAALSTADRAIEALSVTSSPIDEVSARLTRAWALSQLGDLETARAEVQVARSVAPGGQQVEVAGEIAELEFYFGDHAKAVAALQGAGELAGDGGDQALLTSFLLEAVRGSPTKALTELDGLKPVTLTTTVAFEARRRASVALVTLLAGEPEAAFLAADAARFSANQGATLWELYARTVAATLEPDAASAVLEQIATQDASIISMAAEAVVRCLAHLSAKTLSLIEAEVVGRPDRWRPCLRSFLESEIGGADNRVAAELLSRVGVAEDIHLLSALGRSRRDAALGALGKQLARVLAPQIAIHDLGRVRISRGDSSVDGPQVRRKVLALLCLLLTKPGFSASREDVTESLWPDLDPGDGLNSLNQTVYFLRRVLEPGFKDELSPGYLHQDGETIWLDRELVDCDSARSRRFIDSLPEHPSVDEALSLLSVYDAPFALDFAYEEWASRYRDPLHASVLRVVEHALRAATDRQDLRRAVALAERALVLEPEADEIQLALIHLYRLTGAHAAAAEQYERYATSMKTLGMEVPPVGELPRPVRWG